MTQYLKRRVITGKETKQGRIQIFFAEMLVFVYFCSSLEYSVYTGPVVSFYGYPEQEKFLEEVSFCVFWSIPDLLDASFMENSQNLMYVVESGNVLRRLDDMSGNRVHRHVLMCF